MSNEQFIASGVKRNNKLVRDNTWHPLLYTPVSGTQIDWDEYYCHNNIKIFCFYYPKFDLSHHKYIQEN